MDALEEKIVQCKDEIAQTPVVVCIRCAHQDKAYRAALAALDGGLRAIEITLTTPGALELIAELSRDPRAVAGAGTVLSAESARDVAEAGGRFAMSPVSDVSVMEAAHEAGLLFIPGAGTASEIYGAHQAGARVVKVFPIGPLGGPGFIKAVRGPLPDIPLLPTNGVTLETVPDFFAAGVWAVGAGAQVICPEAMARGDWQKITALAEGFLGAIAKA